VKIVCCVISTVKLYSCKYNLPKEMKSQELISSQLVGKTLESCQEFCKMDVSPEFVRVQSFSLIIKFHFHCMCMREVFLVLYFTKKVL
jgi:hypothetical protein